MLNSNRAIDTVNGPDLKYTMNNNVNGSEFFRAMDTLNCPDFKGAMNTLNSPELNRSMKAIKCPEVYLMSECYHNDRDECLRTSVKNGK